MVVIFGRLTAAQTALRQWISWTLRSLLSLLRRVISLPFVWIRTIASEILSPSGYKMIGVLLTIYVFLYQQRWQTYLLEVQRDEQAYNSFLSLAASGDQSAFPILMRSVFAKVQLTKQSAEPSFYWWWWDDTTTQPYAGELGRWVEVRLETCRQENCGGTSGRRVDLRKADLFGAHLGGTNMSQADISDAMLRTALLSSVDFSGSDLSRADLGFTSLSDSNFTGAILDCADLRNSTALSPDEGGAPLRFTDTKLRGANLENVVFTSAHIERADFSEKECGLFRFQTKLSNASLTYAEVIDTSFKGVDLTNVDFSNARFRNVRIAEAITVGTVWPKDMVTTPDGIASTKPWISLTNALPSSQTENSSR